MTYINSPLVKRYRRGAHDARGPCPRCGDIFTKWHLSFNRGYCKHCKGILEEEGRLENRQKQIDVLKSKYSAALIKCDTGICDTLKMHREVLADDPERLSTDFILELACHNSEKLENYRIKRAFRMFTSWGVE